RLPQVVHHGQRDPGGCAEHVARRRGEEVALHAQVAVVAAAKIGGLVLRLGEIQGAVLRIAHVAAVLPVDVALSGVRDGGTVVVRAADEIAIGIAAAAVHAGAGLTGVGERAGVGRGAAGRPVGDRLARPAGLETDTAVALAVAHHLGAELALV